MAGQIEAIESFFGQTGYIDVPSFIISMILSAILAYILGEVYVRYGTAISNRRRFARNFVLVSTGITLIITVVKSSLALSLGLVGALSIVRFRAAIKDPEELSFLFIVIAIGLGFGANQWLITSIAFLIIIVLIITRSYFIRREKSYNFYLTISGEMSRKLDLKEITRILKKHSKLLHLRRFDKSKENLEAVFNVEFSSFEDFQEARQKLSELSKDINISYLDKLDTY